MALGDLLSSAAVVLALGSAAWVGLQRGDRTNLREQLVDARSQITSLKEERTEDKAVIARQASDIDALRRVVTGEVHWQAISEVLDDHHTSAQEHWRADEELLAKILEAVRRSDR